MAGGAIDLHEVARPEIPRSGPHIEEAFRPRVFAKGSIWAGRGSRINHRMWECPRHYRDARAAGSRVLAADRLGNAEPRLGQPVRRAGQELARSKRTSKPSAITSGPARCSMDELSGVLLGHNERGEHRRAIPVKTGQAVVPVNDPVVRSVPYNQNGSSQFRRCQRAQASLIEGGPRNAPHDLRSEVHVKRPVIAGRSRQPLDRGYVIKRPLEIEDPMACGNAVIPDDMFKVKVPRRELQPARQASV